MTIRFFSKMVVLLIVLILICISLPVFAGTTERVSVSSTGAQGHAGDTGPFGAVGYPPSISADGRYVAFSSTCSTLVSGDGNAKLDVFVRDRIAGTTERVSVSSTGVEGNDACVEGPVISADGRFVAFCSKATNLVDGDTNGKTDIFIHDRVSGTTELINVSSSGEQANFESRMPPSISADGRYVVFYSEATNLVTGDVNGKGDAFIRDREADTTELVSISSTGIQGNDPSGVFTSISADGRFVAFESYATNLVSVDNYVHPDIFIRDRINGTTERAINPTTEEIVYGMTLAPSLSPDGRYLTFSSTANYLVPSDTNNKYDIFICDRTTGEIKIVSISSTGESGNDQSYDSTTSADGRYVTFYSYSSNLVPGDTNGGPDIFRRDMVKGTIERVNVSSAGIQANGRIYFHFSTSEDGRYVAFNSDASNLVPDDTNGKPDIFVRDTKDFPPTNVSLTPNNGTIAVDQKTMMTSTYSNPGGYANIKTCYLLINTTCTTANSGYFYYDAAKNKLYLRKPDQAVLIGGYAPGKAQVIDNGFITLNCAQTSIQKSGNSLIINWSVTLKPYFEGTNCKAWMQVTNMLGLSDLLEQMGEFSVIPNPAPKNVSLTPNNGTITVDQKTTLSSVYSDSAGYSNIKSCYLMINPGSSTTGTGYFFYDAVKNKLYLRRPYDSTLIGGFAPGSANIIDNGCISLYCADTTIQKDGKNVTINWSVALSSYFDGSPCTASMQVTNKTGYSDSMEQMGSFSVD